MFVAGAERNGRDEEEAGEGDQGDAESESSRKMCGGSEILKALNCVRRHYHGVRIARLKR